MTRDEFVQATAMLLAQLSVPASMGLPIGGALSEWKALHKGLNVDPWAFAGEYAAAINKILDAKQEAV